MLGCRIVIGEFFEILVSPERFVRIRDDVYSCNIVARRA